MPGSVFWWLTSSWPFIIAERWHSTAFLRVNFEEENLKAPSSVVTPYFLINYFAVASLPFPQQAEESQV